MTVPAAPAAGRPRRLLIVMAYHNEREFAVFQEILGRWDDLVELRSPFRFLFVTATDRKLSTRFDHEFLYHQDPPNTKLWKCVSMEWARVAQFIEESGECDVWLWWESDVLPVRRDTFDFLLSQWTDECKITGYRVRDRKWGMRHRINGVAFYARDYWSFVKPHYNLDGTFDTRRPYLDPKRDRFVELNRWYLLVAHEQRIRLTSEIRLVHGIRDRTLLAQVLEGASHYPYVPVLYRELANRVTALWATLYRAKRDRPER